MAIRFVTVAQARVVSGISSTLISDNDMTEMIEDIEYQVENFLNANFSPSVQIDVMDGNSKSVIFTKKAPLLSVRSVETNEISVSLDEIDFKKGGQIRLLNGAEARSFQFKRKSVIIKYIHGRVKWDKLTETTSSNAETAGTSVVVEVPATTGFAIGNWIEIFGTDGNREAAQITAVVTDTSLTVDELIDTHVAGSQVRLLKIDKTILRLIKLYVGIGANARALGQSFDDITGYSIEDFQVQKGEPFTQFRETIIRLDNDKKEILKKVRPTPGILI